jgi:hypothetical protein
MSLDDLTQNSTIKPEILLVFIRELLNHNAKHKKTIDMIYLWLRGFNEKSSSGQNVRISNIYPTIMRKFLQVVIR